MNRKLKKLEISDIAIFVAISVLVLIVSYMLAAQLYDKSHLIPYCVLVVLFFLLLESGVACCYSFLDKLSSLAVRKSKKDAAPAPSPLTVKTTQEEQERQKEIYRKSEAESIAETEEYKLRRKKAIQDYVSWAVAPILEQEDMQVFWIEYEGWIDSASYKPIGRSWKWKKDVNVKYLDMCHLTWNIATRMGMKNGYGTNACASFIKKMFPDLCANVKDTTLSQNLKADGKKGYVKIDEPEESDPIAFHYPDSDSTDTEHKGE